jgi:hypothetical protein
MQPSAFLCQQLLLCDIPGAGAAESAPLLHMSLQNTEGATGIMTSGGWFF